MNKTCVQMTIVDGAFGVKNVKKKKKTYEMFIQIESSFLLVDFKRK